MAQPCTNVDKLINHEERIQKLENQYQEVKYNLLAIESSQKDIKLLMQQLNGNQNDLLNKFVNSALSNSKISNEIKKNNNDKLWSLLFKVWAISSPLITGLIIYIQK